MEILFEKAREYIIALQKAGDFSDTDTAVMSGVAEGTVRNITHGKTEKNPGFTTIAKIVTALGGDLNELIGYEKKKEIEVNSMISLKESYEMRIADIISSCETRIEDIKALCETRIADVKSCCETRLADMRQNYEERLNDYKEALKG